MVVVEMISVVIPVIDNHEMTERCIDYLWYHSSGEVEVIIVDNASEISYVSGQTLGGSPYTVLRNEENVGVPAAIWQGAEFAHSDVIVFIHNDVYIHEDNWDVRVRNEFDIKPKLGIAGFFGAPGVTQDGGRYMSMSNMLGLVGGSKGELHGLIIDGEHPASVLDGLSMIFRKSVMAELDISQIPQHHWYDRIIPLEIIARGYWCETIGIAFDHDSGRTAGKKQYSDSSKKWLEENNQEVNEDDIDGSTYNAGYKLFYDNWAQHLPLFVDENFNYIWRAIF